MTDQDYIRQLRTPTTSDPLRILISGCLTGIACGYDGNGYPDYPGVQKLLVSNTARLIPFCPEDFAFGSPRALPDIHGGTGLDVLEGQAKFLTESGEDWTEGIIAASEKMLEVAKENDIELAVLMDISATCGSQVIYSGSRTSESPNYQIGAGVAAAQLIRNGFKVISQRDFASLELLYTKLDPTHALDQTAKDHHQTDWYKQYFKTT